MPLISSYELRERIDRTRDFLNAHRVGSAIVLVVAILLFLSLAIYHFLGSTSGPSAPPPQEAYYDEKTGKLSMESPGQVPPILGPGGAELVRAHLAPGSSTKIHYLETYTKAGKDGLETVLKNTPPAARVGILTNGFSGQQVRSPVPGAPWVAADSPQGRAIMAPPSLP